MLARLKRETETQRAPADEGRLEPLRTSATRSGYAAYLTRIYGFEAPIEAALRTTRDLGQLVDLRWRSYIRLLIEDLAALDVPVASVPTTDVPRFASVTEALGWMYVIEQSAMLHGQLHRHFAHRLPKEVSTAGGYLLGGSRGLGTRLNDLGAALDVHATSVDLSSRIVAVSRLAFRKQRAWFNQSIPPGVSNHAVP